MNKNLVYLDLLNNIANFLSAHKVQLLELGHVYELNVYENNIDFWVSKNKWDEGLHPDLDNNLVSEQIDFNDDIEDILPSIKTLNDFIIEASTKLKQNILTSELTDYISNNLFNEQVKLSIDNSHTPLYCNYASPSQRVFLSALNNTSTEIRHRNTVILTDLHLYTK